MAMYPALLTNSVAADVAPTVSGGLSLSVIVCHSCLSVGMCPSSSVFVFVVFFTGGGGGGFFTGSDFWQIFFILLLLHVAI